MKLPPGRYWYASFAARTALRDSIHAAVEGSHGNICSQAGLYFDRHKVWVINARYARDLFLVIKLIDLSIQPLQFVEIERWG